MAISELRNLVDKDALMNSIEAGNAKLESAIKELSQLRESCTPANPKFKKLLALGLKNILHGLQS